MGEAEFIKAVESNLAIARALQPPWWQLGFSQASWFAIPFMALWGLGVPPLGAARLSVGAVMLTGGLLFCVSVGLAANCAHLLEEVLDGRS